MTRRTDPPALQSMLRPHTESRPSLGVTQLKEMVGLRAAAGVWKIGDRSIGRARLRWLTRYRLGMGYEIKLPDVEETYAGTERLQFVARKLERYNNRWRLQCRCDRRVDTMYFDVWWGCRICNELPYASQVIGTPAQRTRRLQEIEALIGEGRPWKMRETRYRQLLAKRAQLLKKLSETGQRPEKVAQIVTCTFHWTERERRDDSDIAPLPPSKLRTAKDGRAALKGNSTG